MSREIWKPVVGFEGHYEVSSVGRVRSLDRFVMHRRHGKKIKYLGRLLRAGKSNPDGYKVVVLRKNKKSVTYSIHGLVARAFIPNPNKLPMVRHLDDSKDNNAVENLAWGTAKQNAADMRCWCCGALYSGRKTRKTNKEG